MRARGRQPVTGSAATPRASLVDQPVTLTTMGMLATIILGGMGMAWQGATMISDVRGEARALALRVSTMEAADQRQSTEIASLRAQADAMALSLARAETKLSAIEAGVARLLQLMDRPGGR